MRRADSLAVVGTDNGVVSEFIFGLLASLNRADGVFREDGYSKTVFGGDPELGGTHMQIKRLGGEGI